MVQSSWQNHVLGAKQYACPVDVWSMALPSRADDGHKVRLFFFLNRFLCFVFVFLFILLECYGINCVPIQSFTVYLINSMSLSRHFVVLFVAEKTCSW